ncbi:MAG: hypothetical protein ACKO6C_03045 [Alphaproteobacteria bacterium]
MKKNRIIFVLIFLISCSKADKNPLIIPPNYSEVPSKEELMQKKLEENVFNQENIDKIKKLLQESD